MADFNSPGVRMTERVIPTYRTSQEGNAVAIVGFAKGGPIGQPVVVTGMEQFFNTFGTAVKEFSAASLAVRKALRLTNRVIFYRVGETEGDHASEYATKIIEGKSIPAESAYITFDLEAPEEGTIDFDIDGKSVTIGAGDSPADIKGKLETALEDGFTVDRNSSTFTVTRVATGLNAIAVSEDFDLTDSFSGKDQSVGPTITFTATNPGTIGDEISIKREKRTNLVSNTEINELVIFRSGVEVERFNISIDTEDENSIDKIISREPENGGSRFIGKVELLDDEEGTKVGLVPGKVYKLSGGTDGIPYEGEDVDVDRVSELFVSAFNEDGDFMNTDLYEFDTLITPDVIDEAVQTEALKMAELRDFIYIVDTPFGLDVRNVIEYHNSPERDMFLNTSYGAMYWSWQKEFNRDLKQYIWYPPSVFILEKFLEIDSNFSAWSAPAGDLRGRISASDFEHSPSEKERDLLYGGENAINPIVFFSQKGLIIYGQKTLLRDQKNPLSRISIRRGVIGLKKNLKRSLEGLIFEPNNPETIGRINSRLTSILEPLRQSGFLSEYLVNVGDQRQEDITSGIVRGMITIVPTGVIEGIDLGINIQETGTTITED